jgi:hypothetical protein
MAKEIAPGVVVTEGENIILNLERGLDIDMIIGRIIDPPLKKHTTEP